MTIDSKEKPVARARSDEQVDQILRGAIEMHCHSGPSVMRRRLDHIEAIEDAAAAGMRAVLFKDHYYSVTPIVELLKKRYEQTGVELFSGIALNNSVGGFNRYAVDHTIKLGGHIVWMPTWSSANHLHHHEHDKDFDKKLPTTKEKMLAPTPLTVLGANNQILDEVKFILDLIADSNLILSGRASRHPRDLSAVRRSEAARRAEAAGEPSDLSRRRDARHLRSVAGWAPMWSIRSACSSPDRATNSTMAKSQGTHRGRNDRADDSRLRSRPSRQSDAGGGDSAP